LCVVIPARDERECLPAALAALANQVDVAGNPLDPGRFEVIVLVNNAQDDSAEIARAFAARHPALALHVVEVTLEDDLAHVGTARRLLMDEASRRFQWLAKPRGVIASTDADSRVGRRWVAATLSAIQAGADAVGGRIIVDSGELAAHPPSVRRYHLLDVGYRSMTAELVALVDPDPLDPWPRHFQHFGPSLAVTTEMYERAGGIPALPWLEDVALVDALLLEDAHLRHDPLVQVVTSARPAGRTGFGFAVQLGMWHDMALHSDAFLVEQPSAVEVRALARRRLRAIWDAGGPRHALRTTGLAADLCVDPDWLMEQVLDAPTFGRLWNAVVECERARKRWRARWPLIEIHAAIRELRLRLSALRSARDGVAHPLEQVEAEAGFSATTRVM
jgi:glycosyltransferase involved in cell wall biosynthesis